jgi:hypothetical protein
MTVLNDRRTVGVTAFSICGSKNQKLFRINPDVPLMDALEQASNLLSCANRLALDGAMGDTEGQGVWAAHYLGEMAKAIIDDTMTTLLRAGGDQ